MQPGPGRRPAAARRTRSLTWPAWPVAACAARERHEHHREAGLAEHHPAAPDAPGSTRGCSRCRRTSTGCPGAEQQPPRARAGRARRRTWTRARRRAAARRRRAARGRRRRTGVSTGDVPVGMPTSSPGTSSSSAVGRGVHQGRDDQPLDGRVDRGRVVDAVHGGEQRAVGHEPALGQPHPQVVHPQAAVARVVGLRSARRWCRRGRRTRRCRARSSAPGRSPAASAAGGRATTT